MSDTPTLLDRVKAKIRALLPEHWRGKAGKRYRTTIGGISDYSKQNIRIREKLEEAPDVAWNSLKLKSSEALRNAADEENKRIASELARQTLTDKARQERATADRMETEARISKIKELEERLALVEKLRSANAVPVWDSQGKMTVLKAPADYDWDGLTKRLLVGGDLSLPGDQSNVDLVGSSHGQAAVSAKDDVEFSARIRHDIQRVEDLLRRGGIPSEESFGTPGIDQTSPYPEPYPGAYPDTTKQS